MTKCAKSVETPVIGSPLKCFAFPDESTHESTLSLPLSPSPIIATHCNLNVNVLQTESSQRFLALNMTPIQS